MGMHHPVWGRSSSLGEGGHSISGGSSSLGGSFNLGRGHSVWGGEVIQSGGGGHPVWGGSFNLGGVSPNVGMEEITRGWRIRSGSNRADLGPTAAATFLFPPQPNPVANPPPPQPPPHFLIDPSCFLVSGPLWKPWASPVTSAGRRGGSCRLKAPSSCATTAATPCATPTWCCSQVRPQAPGDTATPPVVPVSPRLTPPPPFPPSPPKAPSAISASPTGGSSVAGPPSSPSTGTGRSSCATPMSFGSRGWPCKVTARSPVPPLLAMG